MAEAEVYSPKKENNKNTPSFFGKLIKDVVIKPNAIYVLHVVNILIIYFLAVILISGATSSYWILLAYPVLLLVLFRIRNNWRERERTQIAHRIPFFADAVANALAVGCTLDQAFNQSVYYLKGDFKEAFEQVILKSSLGKRLGPLLNDLDNKFPNTGFRYLICLFEEYKDLGIGISPLLKKIAEALKIKEEEEEKIRTILSAGSSYARLSLFVFGLSFFSFALLLRDQLDQLLSPELKPTLTFLIAWAGMGLLIVFRITSLKFSNHYALRPYVITFMNRNQWTINELLDYSGIEEKKLPRWRRLLLLSPLLVGFVVAYAVSLYDSSLIFIMIAYFLGILVARFCIEFILKGLVEDQLIKAVDTFPDFLQVFTIGLNSGLNQFNAFQFAVNAIEGSAPELLIKELKRTKEAIGYGEPNDKAWQRLVDRLPFETITDFCELMIISPLHGESIMKSIEQLMSSYQTKRLALVEKKATKLSQYVIPVIVMSLFPLFMMAFFGPMWLRLSGLFSQ